MATFGRLLESGKTKTQKRRLKIFGSKSPPLCLKKKVVKTVYLHAAERYSNQSATDWYVIKVSSKDHITTCWRRKGKREGSSSSSDQNNNKKHSVMAIKPISKKTSIPSLSRCLAVGSTVYSIGGGLDQFCVNVRAAKDANCITRNEWLELAPMMARRSCAEAVAVDGKIYVFFGLDDGSQRNSEPIEKGPVGEVFDPVKNKWEPISEPPVALQHDGHGPCYSRLFAVAAPAAAAAYDDDDHHNNHDQFNGSDVDESGRIILGSLNKSGVLATYNVRCDTWEILDTNFGNKSQLTYSDQRVSPPVLIDNTLYWVWVDDDKDGGLTAYDLELKMWSQGPIKRLNRRFYYPSNDIQPQFFYFCGDLCYLIWNYYIPNHNGGFRSIIHCVRIRISKRVDKEKQNFRVQGNANFRVQGNALTTKSYLVDNLIGYMYGVVL